MISPPVVLCVTRTYPPVLGGMEKLSYEFTTALARKTKVLLIANRYGKRALPFFLPYAALRLRQLAPHADIIHLGDPLLTVLLPTLPHPQRRGGRRSTTWGARLPIENSRDPETSFTGCPVPNVVLGRPERHVVVTIHGLDLLYPNVLYQTFLRRFLPRADLAICISRFVAEECRKRFPDLRTIVVTPGTDNPPVIPRATRADLERALDKKLGSGSLLLSVARLVPRKGIAEFVEHVLPDVSGAQFLVIGEGPERERIVAAAKRAGTADRVTLAGSVTGKTLRMAYGLSDLFIMPNVSVPGDVEGFGLVALEAAAAGLPVLASNLEGIPDAVRPDKTGYLLPAQEPPAWVEIITILLADHERRARLSTSARLTAQHEFSVERMAETATDAFKHLCVVAQHTA